MRTLYWHHLLVRSCLGQSSISSLYVHARILRRERAYHIHSLDILYYFMDDGLFVYISPDYTQPS
jgi:hypothetical protein